MNIQLNKPYSITSGKIKRYEEHYQIPAGNALVVPQRALGDECSCDVRWVDISGELHVVHNLIFNNENLVSLDFLRHDTLYALWKHYY